MPHYMTQFSYTADAWKALAQNPTNRLDVFAAMAAKLGVKVVAAYYAFGEYDGVIISEAPDDKTAAAAVIAAMSPGHLRSVKTTVLMTGDETVEALRKAATVTYQGPS
ncbi:MAG: GYD domain-containing protein [Chloroflexota bacterium]